MPTTETAQPLLGRPAMRVATCSKRADSVYFSDL